MKKVCVAIFLCGFTLLIQAQEFATLVDKLNQISLNESMRQDAILRGQSRSMLCGYCHGKDGNSVKDYIPNLAQQNPEYLLSQFQQFASGQRKSYVMEQVAKSLSDMEMIDLSLYFSSHTVIPSQLESTSVKGKARYQSVCFACHGTDGKGSKNLPRLAGQKKAFLLKSLNDFKQGKSARMHSPMVAIMKTIDSAGIEPLADYISFMK